MPKEERQKSMRSQHVQELMDKVPNWIIRWGNLVLLFITFSIFLLSWIIKYPETISCEVLVKSSPNVYQGYSRTNAILDSVFVKDGGVITKNHPILTTIALTNNNYSGEKESKKVKEVKQDTLISDFSKGIIYYTKKWRKGEKITAGVHLFNIVPQHINNYLAELKIPVREAKKIKLGQAVKIKLKDYPYKENGIITGQVDGIAAIHNTDGFNTVTVILPKKMITSFDKKVDFKQDMEGSAEVVIQDLRLLERFLSPFREILGK